MKPNIDHRIADITYNIWLNILWTNLCYAITESNHNQVKPRGLQTQMLLANCGLKLVPQPLAERYHKKRTLGPCQARSFPAAGGWGTPMGVSSLTSTSALMRQSRRFTCTETEDSQLTGRETDLTQHTLPPPPPPPPPPPRSCPKKVVGRQGSIADPLHLRGPCLLLHCEH